MTTGIVRDDRYKAHNMGSFHVESPQRLEAIYRMIDQEIDFPLTVIEPRPAADEEIAFIHTRDHIDRIQATAGLDRMSLDPDTSTSARSYEVALLAAGGVLAAADSILEGKVRNAFALVRPPGHHAEASEAMGFCLFNNIAVGAEHLIRRHGLKRILIVDWDLHHGNGTQHSFERRSDVLFFSTHQYPHYPGTGHWRETGTGQGKGFTINVPLVSAKTEADFLYIYERILLPVAAQYKPEFILVSAGFDIYEEDPLGAMQVSGRGFGALAGALLDLASEHCRDRLLFTLEGGYDLHGLKEGVKHVLTRISGNAPRLEITQKVRERTKEELKPVIATVGQYWDL